jgi:hypothetical protein
MIFKGLFFYLKYPRRISRISRKQLKRKLVSKLSGCSISLLHAILAGPMRNTRTHVPD